MLKYSVVSRIQVLTSSAMAHHRYAGGTSAPHAGDNPPRSPLLETKETLSDRVHYASQVGPNSNLGWVARGAWILEGHPTGGVPVPGLRA